MFNNNNLIAWILHKLFVLDNVPGSFSENGWIFASLPIHLSNFLGELYIFQHVSYDQSANLQGRIDEKWVIIYEWVSRMRWNFESKSLYRFTDPFDVCDDALSWRHKSLCGRIFCNASFELIICFYNVRYFLYRIWELNMWRKKNTNKSWHVHYEMYGLFRAHFVCLICFYVARNPNCMIVLIHFCLQRAYT